MTNIAVNIIGMVCKIHHSLEIWHLLGRIIDVLHNIIIIKDTIIIFSCRPFFYRKILGITVNIAAMIAHEMNNYKHFIRRLDFCQTVS